MAASASTLTTFDAMMKELYEGTDPQDTAQKTHVFFSKLSKKGSFVGDVLPTPVAYGHPMGRSRKFSTAQSRASASKTTRFMVTRIKDYGVVTIDSELMLASKGDLGAFAEARKFEVDQMLEEVGDSISRSLFRDQKGLIGQRASQASATILLADIGDIRNWSVGMAFGAVSDPYGTPALRSGTGVVTVVDRTLGKITYSGTITSIADNDYLFADGDFDTASTALQAQSFSGLAAWLPFTAPTSGDSFFSVDRSIDATRLAGQRLDSPNAPIHENISLLAEICAAESGKPQWAFINHRKYTELVWELGSKVEYTAGGEVSALFRGVKVPYSGGWLEVYGDADCPRTRGYVIDPSVCELRYLGPGLPHLVDDDGNMATRASDADGIEVRGRMYGNFRIKAPARCGVFSLSA